MDTWNRLTAVRGEGVRELKVKRLAKEHICITHRHRHQCGEGQGGSGARWRWKKWGGKWGTSVIASTIKTLTC